MRLALVQLGRGLAPLSRQVEALKAFAPDAWHVEEGINLVSTRRVMERLEQLTPGDRVCVFRLDCLRPDLGAALRLCAELLARGIAVEAITENDQSVVLGAGERDAGILALFADLHRRRQAEPAVAAACLAEQELLTAAQVEEIRRLHRAGLSPRRIGMIFRRSPRAISAIVGKPAAGQGAPTARAG
jgi:hypothetical protein